MYSLIASGRTAEQVARALRKELRRGAEIATQTLSTPGGDIRDASIMIRRDLKIWAYIAEKPDRRKLYVCMYGAGEPTWQPHVEINIPTRRTLHCYGQVLTDIKGTLYLAHKGGLGGGKFTVAPAPFGDLINGFEREPIEDRGRQLEYFVLGEMSRSKSLIGSIAEFVHEAKRIRDIRRTKTRYVEALRAVGSTNDGDEYRDELGGEGEYWIQRKVRFRRIHAQIHKALALELRKRGLNLGTRRQKYGLGPDLYTKDDRGRMNLLFEIKVPPGSQATFTALGQLLVYSCAHSPQPRRILVTRGLPTSPQFQEAFSKQRVEVLRYLLDDANGVVFTNIHDIL